MSHYKPYPAYKDSGVEWLGEVPEHWKVRPVKHLYNARLGKMVQPQQKSDKDILVPYHRAQTVQWERVEYDQVESMWANPAEVVAYSLEEGDLLICEGGDVCRAAVFNQVEHERVIFQNSIHRVRPLDGNQPEWLLRLMQHVRSSGWIDVLCNKNTIVHFTSEKLASLECPHPPPAEQAKILSTLRRETTRIDALIAKKTRFIELLKEKRQALITHAVTKGLDPNVTMKDSGVEWIGEVPEHWGRRKIAHAFAFVGSGTTPPTDQKAWYSDTGIPWITTGELRESVITKTSKYVTTKALETFSTLRLYPVGSLAIAMYGATIGRLGILGTPATTNQACCVISGEISLRIRFVYYWLLAFKQPIIDLFAAGGGQPNINQEVIVTLRVPAPNLAEQSAIAAAINRETTLIDALIAKTQRSIDLLKERRSAFITAAVTGKIDVIPMDA